MSQDSKKPGSVGDPLNSHSIPVGASREHLLILRLKRLLDADINKVLSDHSELSLAQWRMISVLSREDSDISQKELVRRTYVTQGQASRALFALQTKGLIAATQSKKDRRSWDYRITEKGHDRFAALLPHMEERRSELEAVLSQGEHDEFAKILSKIARVTEERLNRS